MHRYRYQYRVSGRYFIKIKYSDSFFIADTTHRYHGLRDGGGRRRRPRLAGCRLISTESLTDVCRDGLRWSWAPRLLFVWALHIINQLYQKKKPRLELWLTCLAGDAAAQLMSFPLSAPQSTAFGTALTSEDLRTY